MLKTMNVSVYDIDMDRYQDAKAINAFYKSKGLDGLELQLLAGEPLPEKLSASKIIGVHTNMFPYWYDLYCGNTESLLEQFYEWGNVDLYYGGTSHGMPITDADSAVRYGRKILYKQIKEELDRAESLGAQYVVFHACENTLTELWTGIAVNRDHKVIHAVIDLVNQLLDGSDYHFDFLLENLWTAGFTFTDPEITRELLEGIHYPRKGIMLDTGHLLHTNLELQTENEAVDYIHRQLDAHGELSSYIKGIHLQQSITGDYVKAHRGPAPKVKGDFWDWHTDAMWHVFYVDRHFAWTTPQIRSVVRRINPSYLTMELMGLDLDDLSQAMDTQRKALGMF